MKRTGKHILLALLMLAACLIAAVPLSAADDDSFTVSVDKKAITMQESIHLTLEVVSTGRTPSFSLSDDLIAGFKLRKVDSKISSLLSGSPGNMRAQYTTTVVYRLDPLETGRHLIPALNIEVGGRTLSSQPIEVLVMADKTRVQNSQPGTSGMPAGGGNRDAFITLAVDNLSPYVGEQLRLDVTLLVRYERDRRYEPREPVLDLKDVTLAPISNRQRGGLSTRINDTFYLSYTRSYILFPQRAGKMTLGPIQQKYIKQVPYGQDFFFGGRNYRNQELSASSDTVEIDVREIPEEGRPESWHGAVGEFTHFRVTATPSEVNLGDTVTLAIDVAGYTDIDALSFPEIEQMEGFKAYKPVISSSGPQATNGGEIYGTKRFEYPLAVLDENLTEFPALTLTWFNPDKGEFSSLSSEPKLLNVYPAREKVEGGLPGNGEARELEKLDSDLRELKRYPARLKPPAAWVTNPLLLGALPLPLIAMLAVSLLARRKEALESDGALRRRMRASRAARPRLKEAEAALSDQQKCYSLIAGALRNFLADWFDVPPGLAESRDFLTQLEERNVGEQEMAEIREIWERCDMARFAGGGGDCREDISRVRKLIARLDK